MIDKRLTKAKAIRSYCLDVCMCGQLMEVRLCPSETCPLFPYRMGYEDISVYTDEIKLPLEEKLKKKAQTKLSSEKNEADDE